MSHTFTSSLGGTFTAGVGVVTPAVESANQVIPVVMTLNSHARLSMAIPAPRTPALDLRTVAGVSLAMPRPAVHQGRPVVPRIWGQLAVSGRAQNGIGHLRAFPDPDPVWDGSSWTVAPPPVPSGAHFMQWSARTLPNPTTFPGGGYLLGTPDARDGTAGIVAGAQQWAVSPGSSYSIPWQSKYPFKPEVRYHIHYGKDGSSVTQNTGVYFTPEGVAHMWADFGSILAPPFTLLVIAVITNFSTSSYLNYVFDAGQDPTPDLSAAQLAAIYANGVSGEIALTESFGYRTAMRVAQTQLQGFNDMAPTTRLARVPFAHTVKPKMLSMVVNGSASYYGVWDAYGRKFGTVNLSNHGPQRLMVMGRQNGILSALKGSSMVVFEIRAWDRHFTTVDLAKQYAALSSTWRFSLYK